MEPKNILDFWFVESSPQQWFAKDEQYDQAIRNRFGETHKQASSGKLDHWSQTPSGAVALVIVLDQFSRNLFRGSPDAFLNDKKALAIARTAVQAGFDKQLASLDMRKFLYMPFMHSEDLAVQDEGLLLFEGLGDPDTLKYALGHRDEIVKLGRFKGRDEALGRNQK